MQLRDMFEAAGYLPPLAGAISDEDIASLLDAYQDCLRTHPEFGPGSADDSIDEYWKNLGTSKLWFKSLHSKIPIIESIARNSSLVAVIKALLGDEVILWGSQIVVKADNEIHKWHVDVETYAWNSVNIWVGLKNTGPTSTLSVIARSHHFRESSLSASIDASNDRSVLQAAKSLDPEANIFVAPGNVGDAFIFNGKMWHGSRNRSGRTRSALLLQYCAKGCDVKIPITFRPPVMWHDFRPPCVII